MDSAPQRIVSLSPTLTRFACALGAAPRIVGISDLCAWQTDDAPRRCGSPRTPDAQLLLDLEPDCILATPEETDTGAIRAQFALATRLHTTPTADFGAAGHHVLALARRIGQEAAGSAWAAAFDAALAEADTRARTPAPRALLLLWAQPAIAAGHESFAGDLLVRCGAHNIAARIGGRNPRAALDQFMRYNPSVIIVASRSSSPTLEPQTLRRYGDVLAVLRRRVHTIEADQIASLNAELPGAVAQVARWLYPDTAR